MCGSWVHGQRKRSAMRRRWLWIETETRPAHSLEQKLSGVSLTLNQSLPIHSQLAANVHDAVDGVIAPEPLRLLKAPGDRPTCRIRELLSRNTAQMAMLPNECYQLLNSQARHWRLEAKQISWRDTKHNAELLDLCH